MEQSIKSSATNYGLYLGGFLSLFTLIGYTLNLNLLVNFWLTLLLLPIIIITFGIISTAKAKSFHDGFLSFKQAFSSYFITIAIGIIISTVVSVIIFNFIDPDAAIELKEIIVEKTLSFMEGMGAPPETIAESIEKIENQDTFALTTQIRSLAQSLIFFTVIGLIVAAIMKKTNPDA
jgi:Protein of unknown function (DUF4199)